MSYDLTHLQRWMQSVISHPNGIAAGIESEAARTEIDVTAGEVEEVIARSQALTSIERLEVYGNAYFARLMECLRESFPTLMHALGEEVFDQFAFGYLQSYPSTSYTLGQLAVNFPRYLDETRPDRDTRVEDQVDWPDFLIDLATLELAIAEVFDGPGVENESLLDKTALAAIPMERWPEVRLTPVVCLRLLKFRYPVNDYFTAVRDEKSPELPEPAPCYVALTRIHYVVRRFALSQAQYELLTALARGQTVGEAIETVLGDSAIGGRKSEVGNAMTEGELDSFAGQLHDWFQQWAEAGFFQAADLTE